MKRLLPLLLVAAVGCDEVSELANELLDSFKTGQRQLSDDDAFKHLSPDRSAAPKTDVSAVQMAIDGEARGGGPMDTSDADELLRSVVFDRQNIEEDRFELVNFGDFGLGDGVEKSNCAYEVPDGKLMEDDYMIPGVENIPVRNQGYRGTCAAFAAIGSIEYAALNSKDGEPASTLPTLDLSEQRFYWMSKEECQDPGTCSCPGCQEGSWYGVGMQASVDGGGLNIPLETDCPYNNMPGDTDTQTPQKASCETGAVQVEEVESWCGMDDLVDLLNRGYAVPYASPLSGNWEANDGLVTAADLSKPGNSIHAGGHAYLIVGYKKLPDMPEEGGVCFYVKNSWGKGWGVAGYTCQTLAWMKEVTFDGFISYQQPVALRVNVRDDLVGAEELPDNDEAEEEEAVDIPDEVEPDPDEDEDVLPAPEPDVDPDPEPKPEPEPEPEPPPAMFTDAKLYGPNETYYEIQIHEDGGTLFVRGKLRAGGGETKSLQLKASGNKLSYKGDEVGARSGEVITLCTGKYAPLCSVRFRKSDKQLYLQFRDDDLRAVQAAETAADKGEWYDLDLGRGYQYGVFIPSDVTSTDFLFNPKTFVRLGSSQPARVSLRKMEGGSDFMIKLSGQEVGVLKPTAPTESALCSGDSFGDKCQIRGLDKAYVLPRNSGSRKKRE